jgi:hypothetical protein
LLYNTLKAEANKLIVEYTYLDLGKDENKWLKIIRSWQSI